MGDSHRYCRIGIFLFSGIVLLVFGVIMFGAGSLFEETTTIETYFNGSVQGLDIGSPVKYRGVKIGEVKDIMLANDVYHKSIKTKDKFFQYGMYVMLRISLTTDVFESYSHGDLSEDIDRLVNDEGVRLRIAYLGITGLAYLEMDFVDIDRYELLPICWKPKEVYIPSTPNTMRRLTETLDDITESVTSDLIPLIGNLNNASGKIPEIVTNLTSTIASLDTLLVQMKTDFPQLSGRVDESLMHMNDIFRDEKHNIQEALNNLRIMTEDMKELISFLKQYPSYAVLGDAPIEQGV